MYIYMHTEVRAKVIQQSILLLTVQQIQVPFSEELHSGEPIVKWKKF